MKKIIFIVHLFFMTIVSGQWYVKELDKTYASFNDIEFFNEDVGIVVSDSGYILRTTNSGQEWLEINSFTEEDLSAISFYENSVWISGDNGTIIYSTDMGLNWQMFSTNIEEKILDISFVGEELGFGVTLNSVLKTTNSGAAWSNIHSSDALYNSISFLDDNIGFATGEITTGSNFNGIIDKTTDGGETWTRVVTTPEGGTITSMFFLDDTLGFATGLDSHFLKTSDGGNTWLHSYVEMKGQYEFEDIFFVSEQLGWLVGWNSVILNTTDGGETWTNQISELPIGYVTALHFFDQNNGIAIGGDDGANGFVLATSNGGITSLHDGDKTLLYPFTLEQNYPNPFNPSTNIKFTISNVGDEYIRPLQTKLIVYDILGREVKILLNKPMHGGNHNIEFNGTSLPSGIYFYKLTVGSFIQTRKMVLLK
ncbi:MAG: T9SS C-terminal target domain-containing protein [Ignavibacteriales bacterium]|nr:YCF48-related protein [Melioribacteraceae bacterium]RJP57974.1 MAG: T9SS C-terminal target domain-containing protein [Ignavibacteriales bacterium]